MADPKIHAGYYYNQQPDGSWKRGAPVQQTPVKPDYQAGVAGLPYVAPQAAANVQKTQADIVDTSEDNRRADQQLAAELYAKGLRIGSNGSVEDIPGWTPPEHLKPATVIEEENKTKGKAQKAEVVRAIMAETLRLYKQDIKGQPASRLWGYTERFDGGEGGTDLIKSPTAERFTRTAEGMLALIRPMVATGAKDGDSNTEMLIFKSYIPAAGDSDVTIESKLRNLETLLNGVASGRSASELQASGNVGATPLVDAALGGGNDRRTPPAIVPQTPGFASGGSGEKSIPIPQAMQDAHTSYLAQNWGRIDPEGYAAFRSQLDQQYGFTPSPDKYRGIVPQLNQRANQGGGPDGLTIPPVNAKMDGLDQVNASLFNNSAGGLMFGAGDQLGLADEMAGGIRSLVNGTPYEVEVARANAMKQAMQDAYGTENLIGNVGGALMTGGAVAKAFPGLTGAFTRTTGRAIGTGAGFGGLSGAGEANDNRFGGGAAGLGLGVAGGSLGAVAAPLVAKLMGTQTGQAMSRAGRSMWNNTGGAIAPSMRVPPAPVVPQMGKGEGLLPVDVLQNAIPNLQDADAFGLPYALADADPKLRMLAGSVSRRSADARQLAESTFEPRVRGQADRLVDTIDTRLAPVTDINTRSADIMRGANIEAGPYYARAKAHPAMADPVVGSILNTSTGKEALKRAHRIASNERRDPSDLGFILDPGGEVRINDAGRYSRALLGNERDALGGTPPTDLIGYLRANGGLADSGGELQHMGLDNRLRAGMDFVGQETRLGPLVSERGMNFDDAALNAWEAGYFPHLTERPTINEFLDAVRDTYHGNRRAFRLEDQPKIDAFNAARDNRIAGQEARFNGNSFVFDNSVPAGPDVPFAPPSAYGREVSLPTYETLHYVRQGFDDILDGYRDKVTGAINLDNEGRAIQNLRRDLSNRLQENPDFRQGDAIYSKGAKRRDALKDGFGILPQNNVPFRDFDARLGRARAYDNDFTQNADRLVPELQRGYATAMADAANRLRLSGNPWESVYGAPVQQQKIASLFPQGAPDFGRIYGLERDMAKTAHETLGGSPTAARQAIDEQFDSGLMGMGANLAADAMGGGGAFTVKGLLGKGAQYAADTARLRGGKAKADAIAPVLYATDPRLTLDYLADLQVRQAQAANRTSRYRRGGGLFGGILPSMVLGTE